VAVAFTDKTVVQKNYRKEYSDEHQRRQKGHR
jgi:hypothetical protein